jgi:hypothetical protein
MINTGTEFVERRRRMVERYDEAIESIQRGYEEAEWEPFRKWYSAETDRVDVIADPGVRDARRKLLEEEADRRASDISRREGAEIDARLQARNAEDLELRREAQPALAYAKRLIIASVELEAAAVELRGAETEPAPDGTGLRFVETLDDLQRELTTDRYCVLLYLLLPADEGMVRLGGQRRSLTQLAALWGPSIRTQVPEVVFFRGTTDGFPPTDGAVLQPFFGVSEIIDQWDPPGGGPVAVIDGPDRVVRGEPEAWSGAASTGDILWHVWSFSRGTNVFDGVDVRLTLLDTVTISLTVSDGQRADTASRTVEVAARPWRTQVEHVGERGFRAPLRAGGGLLHFGANICAQHGPSYVDTHLFHRRARARSWRNDASIYELARVDNPGGPDHRRWYVRTLNLRISRVGLVNNAFWDQRSAMYLTNRRAEEATGRTSGGVADLRASVIAHVAAHSYVMFNELVIDDPAVAIEARTAPTKAALDLAVNLAISDAENRLAGATNDHAVVRRYLDALGWDRPGSVLLREAGGDDYVPFPIPSFAGLGCGARPF